MKLYPLIMAVVIGFPLLLRFLGGNNGPVFMQRILGGSIGPRIDVENMTRKELLSSGTKFSVFGAGCILVIVIVSYFLVNIGGVLFGLLVFPLSFGALIGCFGGIYLLVRGVLRDREYMVDIPMPSREPLNDFQNKICSSLDEILKPYRAKADVKSGTFMLKKKGEPYYWEEYTVNTGRPRSFQLKIKVHVFFLRINMDEWWDDYNVYESGLSSDEFATNASKMIMEVLSGKVKIEVESINGKPYKWTRYDLIDGKWNAGQTLESRIHGIVGKRLKEDRLCRIS